MLKKIWKNRLEFYPAFVFIVWYSFTALGSLGVKKSGMVQIGWFTVPCLILFIIAIVRTYRELPDGGKKRD